MKQIINTTMRLIAVGIILIGITACGDPASTQRPTAATITALPETSTAALAVSTSTPAPTLSAVEQRPDLLEARKQLEAKNFEMAVSLLNRDYANHRDDAEVKQQFAHTYIVWGQSIEATSAGDPALVSSALDKFTSGLAVAPETGDERVQLQNEADIAEAFLQATDKLQKLKTLMAANGDSSQQREQASALAEQLNQLRQQRSDFPGLQGLYVQGMIAAGNVYLAASGQGSEQDALREQALNYCQQALLVDAQSSDALGCQQRAVPTPTLSPKPTRTPEPIRTPTATHQSGRLYVRKINSNDAPGCISIGVSGISTTGWTFTVNGLHLGGTFSGGNARVCGLPDHGVTFTIFYANGRGVPGGNGIPAAGRDIFKATWR